MTGMEAGLSVLDLNSDFVQEVEVKTGGLSAEYGRATGGIVNVITRSGGNEFHGSAFGFFAGGGLQSADRTAASRPADTTTVDDVSSRYDFSVEVGGRIVRDRLWFFAALNRVAENSRTTVIHDLEAPAAPSTGSVVPSETRDDRFAGKLTWRPGASSTLGLSVFGDPRSIDGPLDAINGPPSTWSGTIDRGLANATLRYEGTFAHSWLVQVLAGRNDLTRNTGGPGTDTPRFDDLTVSPAASTGGLGRYTDRTYRRDVARLDVTKGLGAHQLKAGGDFEALDGELRFFVSGGDNVTKLAARGLVFYRHSFYADGNAPGFVFDDPATWQPVSPFAGAFNTLNLSAYAQDAWRAGAGVTVNAGLRFESQRLSDTQGRTVLGVDNWAPRIAVAWDVRQRGRTRLYAGFGRSFENIPLYIQPRAFGGLSIAGFNNFDPTPGSFAPDPAAPPTRLFASAATPVATATTSSATRARAKPRRSASSTAPVRPRRAAAATTTASS